MPVAWGRPDRISGRCHIVRHADYGQGTQEIVGVCLLIAPCVASR